MPNWCQNVAYINHDDKEKLKSIVSELDKGDETQLFNSLVPNPSGEWNYDWSVENWGCKWDAQVYEYSMEPEHLYISFDTAWGPPTTFYDKLGEMGFEVKAFYREEGMAFAGLYIDGDDDYYEYGGMSADEIEEQLPTELDEMFSISQYQRDYEQESLQEEWNDLCNSLEKTEWYPAKIKPVTEGVYEVTTESWPYPNKIYWNGDDWCWYDFQSNNSGSKFPNKVKEWRGITGDAVSKILESSEELVLDNYGDENE